MFRLITYLLLVGLVTGLARADAQEKKKMKIEKKWSGSVVDESLPKPDVITNAKALEAIWKSYAIKADLPKIDFSKELVVGVYSVGSKLDIAGATLDEKGNLD